MREIDIYIQDKAHEAVNKITTPYSIVDMLDLFHQGAWAMFEYLNKKENED